MTREERKAKLQKAKEKLENWQSSLPKMKEFTETTYKELKEYFAKTQEKPSPEEEKELNELLKEMEGIKEAKILDSIDNVDFLEEMLIGNWGTLIEIRKIKRGEGYEKDEGTKKKVEA
ncbi:159_t:CDS:2 [Entrophospora sp. SA101]|nr:159_t:CDS:2 [Entrophospora sp. SA101]